MRIVYFLLFIGILALLLKCCPSTDDSGTEYLTNVTESRSFFTENMRETVDYNLGLIGCSPEEYYYSSSNNNRSICYVCEDTTPCFGYIWMDTSIGSRMVLSGPVYLENTDFDLGTINFYYDGLGTHLDCRRVENVANEYTCDYGISFFREAGDVKMRLSDGDNMEDVAGVVCDVLGSSSDVECDIYTGNEVDCRCDDVYVRLYKGAVNYGYIG